MKPTLVCALLALSATVSAEPTLEVAPEALPRIPATEPEDALKTFELDPGFRLILAAHEPEVCDPIAMCFDERGRAYVLEMRGYSERREEALGRIRLLTDRDQDGIFDDSVIFKEGLRWPTAITCYRGGVFVGATPDLFYFKDTDDDGVADEEKIVFTGFGGGNPRLNMQALFNSLRWGPDNRIWGATAANGGNVTRPESPDLEPVSIRGSDFSFDPEELDLRAENGTAQYGMSFDSLGRRFVCSNSRHIIHVAYERHHVWENPSYPLPKALEDIAVDGSAAPVYRISPDEPWRIVRTRWRVAGVVKGIVEGGGRVSGYFTSATGIHLYWGNAFGEDFQNNAFIGDVGSNLVHRKVVRTIPDQVGLEAVRANPDEKTEFLRSRDNWFRPTSFVTGPDGCLYVTDMYREVIEHPWSLPEPIKNRLDLNSGFDRGRLYRIEPQNFVPATIRDLTKLSLEELQKLARHENDWHQTTARRLLYEKGEPAKPKAPTTPFPALLSSKKAHHDLRDAAAKDPWIRAAYLNSLRTPEDVRVAWEAAKGIPDNTLTQHLLSLIWGDPESKLIREVMTDLASRELTLSTAEAWRVFLNRPHARSHDWIQTQLRDGDGQLLKEARTALANAESNTDKIVAAIQIVSLLGTYDDQEGLQALFIRTKSKSLKNELWKAISDISFLIAHSEKIPDHGISSIGQAIAKRPDIALLLLRQISVGDIPIETFPASLAEALRNHPDSEVQQLASKTFPELATREEVIQSFLPSLKLSSSLTDGKSVFLKLCSTCHQSQDGDGIRVGPDTVTFSGIGREVLLTRILDPHREVAPQYQTYVFTLDDKSILTGIIESESPTMVTLLFPGGTRQSFPREKVKSMKGLGQSLMPEGLENAFTHQDMADLIGFLEAESKVP